MRGGETQRTKIRAVWTYDRNTGSGSEESRTHALTHGMAAEELRAEGNSCVRTDFRLPDSGAGGRSLSFSASDNAGSSCTRNTYGIAAWHY